MSEMVPVSVNAEPHELPIRPEEAAIDILRDRLGLTGTELVYGEGVCGAYTVLLDDVPVVRTIRETLDRALA